MQAVDVTEAAGEGGVAGEVFVENRADDLYNCFILKDTAVAAVCKGGEGRFDGQGVFGETAVGTVLLGSGD